MLKIRLQRVGRKNEATFRLVVLDSHRGPKAGNPTEILGSYNPKSNFVQFDKDRILHWISVGAQVSDTVHNILVSEKLIEGKKKNVLSKKSPIVKETSEGEKPVADKEPAVTKDNETEADKKEEAKDESNTSPGGVVVAKEEVEEKTVKKNKESTKETDEPKEESKEESKEELKEEKKKEEK